MLLLLDIVFIAPRQKTVLLAFFTERRGIAAKSSAVLRIRTSHLKTMQCSVVTYFQLLEAS